MSVNLLSILVNHITPFFHYMSVNLRCLWQGGVFSLEVWLFSVIVAVMRHFFILCLILCSFSSKSSARQLELDFPGLAERVKVFLPEGHDPKKKYPALFYFHGAGGKPDTSLMRHYTRDKNWIIIGMSYYQQGPTSFDKKSLDDLRHLYRSVQNHIKVKYGLDPTRCYVAGFSKGGWVCDMLVQSDPDIAGAVILGAGHLDQVKKSPRRYAKNKPMLIGIGRKDPNYPFALQAMMFHRGLGASTVLEVWNDLGHTVPPDGAHALYQWLLMQVKSTAVLRPIAQKEMQDAVIEALEMKPLAQWDRLRHLRQLPYVRLMSKAKVAQLDGIISELEVRDPVKRELAVLNEHRKLIRLEIKKNSLESVLQVHPAYLALSEKYPNTRQAKLARHDYDRTTARVDHFIKQKKTKPQESSTPIKPKKVDLPTKKRRIPVTPFIR